MGGDPVGVHLHQRHEVLVSDMAVVALQEVVDHVLPVGGDVVVDAAHMGELLHVGRPAGDLVAQSPGLLGQSQPAAGSRFTYTKPPNSSACTSLRQILDASNPGHVRSASGPGPGGPSAHRSSRGRGTRCCRCGPIPTAARGRGAGTRCRTPAARRPGRAPQRPACPPLEAPCTSLARAATRRGTPTASYERRPRSARSRANGSRCRRRRAATSIGSDRGRSPPRCRSRCPHRWRTRRVLLHGCRRLSRGPI